MENLTNHNSLVVQQKKEWGEILVGFEQKNKYAVMSEDGDDVYFAAEEGGSTLVRLFLKGLRPFTMVVLTRDGKRLLQLKRPFRFFFYKLNVFEEGGGRLGSIERKFAIFRRLYSVKDEKDQEIYQLFGPILHPWTFKIQNDGNELGKITKEWSGLMKEMFTKADNFGIVFPADATNRVKGLLLGAVFLIDFAHFETKN